MSNQPFLRNHNLDDYLYVLSESGLIEFHAISNATKTFRELYPKKTLTVTNLGQMLIDQGYITAWQQFNLLKGRTKGFFVGKYKIQELLSTAPTFASFAAIDSTNNQSVALQILLPSAVEQRSYLKRFYKSAEAALGLEHPNLAKVLDFGKADDGNGGTVHYMVTEYVFGDNLENLIQKQGPFSVAYTCDIVRQAAKGLGCLHENEIVHRNVKPSNLLLDQDGEVKVCNLGVARFLNEFDEDESLTIANGEKFIGTVDYMSPEQVYDSHSVTPSSDLYSLGCTMFYLLTGHTPFEGGTPMQRMLRRLHEVPPQVNDYRSGIPVKVSDICHRMIALNESDRPSRDELCDEISQWLVVASVSWLKK